MSKTKAASKSEAKRVTVQNEARESSEKSLASQLRELSVRITALEANKAAVAESFDFVANECRPIYGMGGLALIFDAVTKRLRK